MNTKELKEWGVYVFEICENRFGYFLCADRVRNYCIIYNFVSNNVVIEQRYFVEANWLRPCEMYVSNLRGFMVVQVKGDKAKIPLMKEFVEILPGYQRKHERRYGLVGPGISNFPPVPEGAEDKFLDFLEFNSAQSLVSYFEENRHRFTMVEGTIDPPSGWDANIEDESADVDLEVHIDTGKCPVHCDALIGEIEEAIENSEFYEFEMIDGSDGEVIVRLPKKDAAKAASIMRKVLLRTFTAEQIGQGVELYLNEDGREPKELSILSENTGNNSQ